MRCTSPRTVGFRADGRTLAWSPRHRSKEYAEFQLPCGKCIDCRLEYARQWAIRCVHEAQMHEKNCFLTLTYNEENLGDGRLHYEDFQKFMKKLRKLQNEPMGFFVTGEYGDQFKRPHWHCIVFNWAPPDQVYKYSNARGDRVYSSATLDRIWGKGIAESGSVTIQSAGYCARYATKKLVHGKDKEHDYQPISKKSSKHAIGKSWLEKYWPDVFNHGRVVLHDGSTTSIPRYYEKWFAKNRPEDYLRYLERVKIEITTKARERSEANEKQYRETNNERLANGKLRFSPTENEKRRLITKQKFEKLCADRKIITNERDKNVR